MSSHNKTQVNISLFLAFLYVVIGLWGVVLAAVTQDYVFSTWLLAVALWLKPSESDHG